MRDEVVNHARELTASSPLEREVKQHFHVSLKPEEAKELAKIIATARAKYRRDNTLFSDFDWAHFVQGFLADKGYKFTKMVARDMNRQAVASELVKVAKELVAIDWTKEATRLEQTLGRVVDHNASKVFSVTVPAGQKDTNNAECDLYTGEIVKAAKEELKHLGWEIDDLTPARLSFGLRRIKEQP
jgi:hypothetical protein